jgi:predicted DNA-binding transcriptional regulator AlpA
MTANHSERLETWKEIAVYLGRDLRTVMRWEKERSLPIRRFPGGGRAAVYAYRSEIDNWLNNSPGALAGETNGEIPGSQNPRTSVPTSDVRPASGYPWLTSNDHPHRSTAE